MEDVNSNISQVQRNFVATQMEIESKKFDKNNIFAIGGNSKIDLVANSESDDTEISGEVEDSNSDIISECIGHIGKWQVFWAALLCFFQFPTTFHIFCLVFQVSLLFYLHIKITSNKSEINGLVM